MTSVRKTVFASLWMGGYGGSNWLARRSEHHLLLTNIVFIAPLFYCLPLLVPFQQDRFFSMRGVLCTDSCNFKVPRMHPLQEF